MAIELTEKLIEKIRALGRQLGNQLVYAPLAEAKALWRDMEAEDQLRAKHIFYDEAEAVMKMKRGGK